MLDKLITSRWLHVVLLMGLLASAVALSFSHGRWRDQIRHFSFDTYNIPKPRVASDNIVIVDIDEASLKELGQMPWPRSLMARMVDNLKAAGAAVVVFDMTFPEKDRVSPGLVAGLLSGQGGMEDLAARLSAMPDNDVLFGMSIAKAGNVVTGFSFTHEPTDALPAQKGVFRGKSIEKFVPGLAGVATNIKEIGKESAGNGSFFVSADSDGIIRRVPMLVAYQRKDSKIPSIFPSLALETVRVLDGERGGRVLLADEKYAELDARRFGIRGIEIGQERRFIPTNQRGEFLIYFAKSNPDWYIPAHRVLSGQVPADKIAGKIVFIGTSAVGLKDIRSTPLDVYVPGVELHLNIVDQILQGVFLTRSTEAEGLEAVSIFCAGLFIILFAPFIGALSLAMIVAALVGGGVYAGWYAFLNYGLLIDVTYPVFSILAIFMVSTILTYLRTERERRQVRQAFGLYISPDFMKELTRDPGKLKLGGETRELSVMFSDIRNFTRICEGKSSEDIIHMMNDFLTPMSDLVMSNRGTIDKYIGDAMMALWNAPLDDADHALHACKTALRMQAALEPINRALEQQARGENPVLLKVGIGINTGLCAVGNMGSRQRFAYSTLGDAVNLASRLEGQTKYYGLPIIVGHSTAQKAQGLAFLEIDLIRVKGKDNPERIYFLAGDEGMAQSDDFIRLKSRHEDMLSAYRGGRFADCLDALEGYESFSLIDPIRDIYKARAKDFLKNPPQNWDGVFDAVSK